jgi:hypothetical protein
LQERLVSVPYLQWPKGHYIALKFLPQPGEQMMVTKSGGSRRRKPVNIGWIGFVGFPSFVAPAVPFRIARPRGTLSFRFPLDLH